MNDKPLPLACGGCCPVPIRALCALAVLGVKASYQMCMALLDMAQIPLPFLVPCLWAYFASKILSLFKTKGKKEISTKATEE